MRSDEPGCRCLACQDDGRRLDTIDTNLVTSTADPGWGLLSIPEDDSSAGWMFTVGLWHSFRAPELAVFGLDQDTATTCLNNIGDLVAAGRALAPHDDLIELFENDQPVTVRTVDERWHRVFFGAALGFYRTTPRVPFLQVVWSDDRGHYPEHRDFARRLEALQPRLWLPPDDHPPGPWTEQIPR